VQRKLDELACVHVFQPFVKHHGRGSDANDDSPQRSTDRAGLPIGKGIEYFSNADQLTTASRDAFDYASTNLAT
jgi:hypothetical protein